MRRFALLCGVSLLMWACTEGAAPTTTTFAPPTSPPSTTLTTASTTTLSTESEWPEILVTNQDGVFSIDAAGEVSQLVKGRVAYAVDDSRGGLLFQVERGRSTWWQGGGPLKDTVVWWVPQGSATAQELLVPTAGAGHDLALYDAFEGDDGHVRVVYVRSSTPEGEEGYWGQTDSLRVFDVETGGVTELWEQGAYEQGFGKVSAAAGLVAATGYEQVWWWCFFLDPAAASVLGNSSAARDDITVEVSDAPLADPRCADDESCKSGCVLSTDGGLLAYRDGSEVTVVDRTSGTRQQFEFIEDRGAIHWGALDLTGTHLLVNHHSEWDPFDEGPAKVISLDNEGQRPVPVEGLARFVSAPINIAAPVILSDAATLELRADGLGLVNFGDPIQEASDRLVEALGAPIRDAQSLEWTTPQLWVIFNHLDPTTGEWTDTLHLTDWGYTGSGGDPGWVLETPEGITVGSTLLDLRGAFGDDLWLCTLLSEEGDISWQWGTKENTFGLFGWFDGNPEEPDARIVGLHAGWLMPDHVCSIAELPEGGTS